jgi:cytidylate kinase
MIITIDGPAGSGKSTAARKLAARLGIPYLDTGAMYRAVTLAALEDRIDLRDEQALTRTAAHAEFDLDCGPTHVRVTLRGRDVTEEIRSMRVNEHTRYLAASPGVRRILVDKQRALGVRLGSMVTEGRDQGSVAFPDADFKFFMDATPQKRAERRLIELRAEGEDVTFEQVLANVEERDRTDAERAVGPLTVPKDAMLIETSDLSISQMLDRLLKELRQGGVEIPPPSPAYKPRSSP